MKTIIRTIIPIFLAAVLFSSCNSSVTTPQPVWTKAMAVVTFTVAAPLPTAFLTTNPETTLMLSMTEEASFWENTGSLPSDISITEYALPPEKNPTENDGLFRFVPTQVWTVGKGNIPPTPNKTTLEDIGYELRTVYTDGGLPYNQQLYRNGRLLLDHVTHVSDIYTVKTYSTPIIAFIVEVDLSNENFLIQNDTINVWGEYAIDTSAPILYKGELLWARTYSDRIEIKKSNGDIVFTLTTPWISNHRPKFRAWNSHWILESNGSVIQDGEILNQKLEFQEIFNWSLIKDKPTYFFRKGSRIGLSYDGKILPLNYQNVAHDLCCGPGQNNPSTGDDAVHFFGERDGVWYYVVMEFR